MVNSNRDVRLGFVLVLWKLACSHFLSLCWGSGLVYRVDCVVTVECFNNESTR